MTQTKRQLFGTDGIRGVAGDFPLNRETVYAIGRALAHDLIHSRPVPRVLLGQDTRESSGWIADALAAGLRSCGAEVASAGVIPTPGVAFLARTRGFDAGVVLSASHNPWTDNGIKVFSGDGYKLPDAEELEIEREIFAQIAAGGTAANSATLAGVPSLPGDAALRQAYIGWLRAQATTDLSSLRILVDCANGAASAEAPELFRACGVDATILHASPDGRNINDGCGALHPKTLGAAMHEAEMRGEHYDLGVTFDGDADRALFCDAAGNVVNGDGVLLLCARDMQHRGRLSGNTVVGTTMANMGLEVALRGSGIALLRADVGDKYVLELMQKSGATLGGEQSGHILFRDSEATTGDGMFTALRVMDVVVRSGKSLAELIADLKVFPQVIKNVRVREKKPLSEIAAVRDAIDAADAQLRERGRVVVRYSGTEALARVMIEAESEAEMHTLADAIVEAIQRELGA